MGKTASMAFGQPSGPPAPARQVRELLGLLQEAGHVDFRDARGPMGFTQRQASGKFTGPEVAGFIDRLQNEISDGTVPDGVPVTRPSADERILARLPAEQLAVELRRRGWTALEPS
jgi:hypothetical protein